jgi:hypothetical protein
MLSPNTINALNQIVIWTFSVPNGPINNAGVSVVVTLPVGWAIQPGVVPSMGTFAGNTWTIGAMIANQTASIAIPVKNSTLVGSPWVFGAQVFGMDTNISNNQFTESVTLTSCDICPPSAGAVADPFACICGNVSTNDTRCTSGITTWIPQALSEVNCVINNMDASTGAYNISVLDLTLPWSFQYSIWCDDGSGPLQTSGPALVSGAAVLVNLNKIPRIVQEDFNPLAAANTVTLSIAPIAGYDVFVFRNGSILPKLDWSVAGAVVTFVNVFGASGGGLYGESVSVLFYKVI